MPLAAAAIGNAADSKAAGVQSVSEEVVPPQPSYEAHAMSIILSCCW